MEINVTRRVLQGAVVLDIPFFNFFIYVIIYLFVSDWLGFFLFFLISDSRCIGLDNSVENCHDTSV